MSNPVNTTVTFPERIYLQRDEQCVAEGCGPHGEDTTWCASRIHATDVEYVRADAIEQLRRERKARGSNVVRGPVPGSEAQGDKIDMFRSEY